MIVHVRSLSLPMLVLTLANAVAAYTSGHSVLAAAIPGVLRIDNFGALADYLETQSIKEPVVIDEVNYEGETYIEVIMKGAGLPDDDPYDYWNDQMAAKSSDSYLTTYEQTLIAAVYSVLDKLLGFPNPLIKMRKEILKDILLAAIFYEKKNSADYAENIRMAMAGMSHTYVYDPGYSEFFKNHNTSSLFAGPFPSVYSFITEKNHPSSASCISSLETRVLETELGKVDLGQAFAANQYGYDFKALSVAPQSAEAEYRHMSRILKPDQGLDMHGDEKKVRWLLQLGRVLHYFQDLTVPHHCELPGNFGDLFTGIWTYYQYGEERAMEEMSQTKYEGEYIRTSYRWISGRLERINNSYWDDDGRRLDAQDVPIDCHCVCDRNVIATWKDKLKGLDEDMGRSIEVLARELRNYIFTVGYMDKCDGIDAFSLAECGGEPSAVIPAVWGINPWCEVYPEYLHYVIETSDGSRFLPSLWAPMVPMPTPKDARPDATCGFDDNYREVADVCLPAALKLTAHIVLRAFGGRVDESLTKRAATVAYPAFSSRSAF